MKSLILNADYTPLAVCHWRKAFNIIYLEKAEIVEVYTRIVKDSQQREYTVPAVIRVFDYIKRKRAIPFSKRNIFLRDKYTCQYCGSRAGHDFPFKELTYDHIKPRSKWNKDIDGPTPTTWVNVVTSCITCNTRKGSKSLLEAKMELLSTPHHPKKENMPIMADVRRLENIPPQWDIYIQSIYKNY